MVQQLSPEANPTASVTSPISYPDSDGQPMADNTQQFRWIVTIKENLELLYADQADVFVAGNLLWYPLEGNNKLRQAPDVMVVFGRPKGERGSYRQWEEAQTPPQVVFEILSPGNRFGEMLRKLNFYQHYGVEEYYIFDPDKLELTGLLRTNNALEVVEEILEPTWTSPRLGIRFQLDSDTLQIYRPDGERFLTYVELGQRAEAEKQRAEAEKQRAEAEKQRAEAEKQRAEAALSQLEQEKNLRQRDQQRIAQLEAKLRELGQSEL
jgi:Uma2 family endonuclease